MIDISDLQEMMGNESPKLKSSKQLDLTSFKSLRINQKCVEEQLDRDSSLFAKSKKEDIIKKINEEIKFELVALDEMIEKLEHDKLDKLLFFQMRVRALFQAQEFNAQDSFCADALLLVILCAKLHGYSKASEIAKFYSKHYLALHTLFDGMPKNGELLTVAKIHRVLSIFDVKLCREFFYEYIGKHLQHSVEISLAAKDDPKFKQFILFPYRRTLYFDGSRLFTDANLKERGKSGRKVDVYLYELSEKIAIDYFVIKHEDNEGLAALQKLVNIDVQDRIIMSDAYNSNPQFATKIIQGGGEYLLPVKKHIHRKFTKRLEQIIKEASVNYDMSVTSDMSTDFCKSKKTLSIFDGSILDKDLRDLYANLNSIAVYTQTTTNFKNGKALKSQINTQYYISSLPTGSKSTLYEITKCIDYNLTKTLENKGRCDKTDCAADKDISVTDSFKRGDEGIDTIVHDIHTFIRDSEIDGKSMQALTYEGVIKMLRSYPLSFTFIYLMWYFRVTNVK